MKQPRSVVSGVLALSRPPSARTIRVSGKNQSSGTHGGLPIPNRTQCTTATAFLFTLVFAAIFIALVVTPIPAAAAVVAPPQSHPYGRSYAEWAAAWWQWALETPVSQNPLLDTTGEFCDVRQTEKIWFLAGSLSSSPVSRTCTVPTGTALLLPLANIFFGAFLTDPPEQKTEEFLRAQVACVEGVVISLTIDGEPVPNPEQYFENSVLFSVQLPPDNIFGVDESVIPELLLTPSVDAGYYVVIRPLPPGTHIIHLVTTSGASCVGPLDVTYTITVTPGK